MSNKKRFFLVMLLTFSLCINMALTVHAHTEYGNVWLNAGSYYASSTEYFTVSNTHTGTVNLTFKVESSANPTFTLRVVNPNGLTVLTAVVVNKGTNSGEGFKTSIKSGLSGTYKIYYTGTTTAGARIMCWMY